MAEKKTPSTGLGGQRPDATPPQQTATAAPLKQSRGTPEDDWHQVTAAIASSLGGMTAQLAENCVVQGWEGDVLILAQLASAGHLATARAVDRLQQALSDYYGRTIRLRLCPAGDDLPRQQAPAERKAEQRAERQRQAGQEMRSNPFVQALTENFDGALIPESIKPID